MTCRSFTLLLALGVVLLSGCAAAPDIAPVAVAGSSSESGSATPSPEPGQNGPPMPTLPVTCGDLFSDATASNLVNASISLKLDELAVRSLNEAARRQAGLLHCTWGGQNKTDNSWDQSLVVDILADAATAFDTGVWRVDDGAIVYPDGSTTSEYLCPAVEPGFVQCFANVLVDGYWAHASLQSGFDDSGMTRPEAEATMRTIVDSLTADIAAAGSPTRGWKVPSGVLQGGICGGQSPNTNWGTPPPVGKFALDRSGIVGCELSGLDATILPGGAWALSEIQARGDRPAYYITNPQPTDIAGTDLALVGCGDGCYAIMSIGGSAVEVWSQEYDQDTFVGRVSAVVPDIIAAG